MVEQENNDFILKKVLFSSIRKKLIFAFGILVILLIILVFATYSISHQIQKDTRSLEGVEAPLTLMVQEVISYDAILTEKVHEALLHAEIGEFDKIAEHKVKYDEVGLKLDDLLKVRAPNLLNQSIRSFEEKQQVYVILKDLDSININLVDLEVGAFNAMNAGDIEKARSLVVSDQYEQYKAELAELCTQWGSFERNIDNVFRQKVLINSRNVQIYNLYFGILFILMAIVIAFNIIKSISRPIMLLIQSTRQLAEGNFKTRAEIKTGDEIQELAESFNKAVETLGKVDEERKGVDKAKTEFLSITSHELRSPMTPMRAQLQMLLADYFGKTNKAQKESLEIVLRNTERLDRIIQDFLEISRIEAARLKFNFVKTNLESNIKSLIDEMRGFMPEKKLKLDLEISKLPIFEADPDRVMQVLRNLLNNAIKFSKENGKIEIKVFQKADAVYFSIKDNGIGIKDNEQSRIFEPFFQAGGMYNRVVGGTGLGLAICKGIVESQKGKIWFESEYGKGTTFHFFIPLIPTREMQPIKLLFSPKTNIENKVRDVLIEFLGPLANLEFEDLKVKGLTEKILNEYINDLHKKGIITNSEEFKSKIRLVFSGKEKMINKKEDSENKFVSAFKK